MPTPWYERNKVRIAAQYVRDREQILVQRRASYAALSPEEKKILGETHRTWDLWARYRLSRERYNAMLVEQANKCACCGREFDETREMRPCVDHDRRCCDGPTSCGGCIRSLLCRWCNRLVGIIEKNPCLLDYIKRGETP